MNICHSDHEKLEMLSWYPFEGDFGEQGDLSLSDKIVRAKTEHECGVCLETIHKNDDYRKLVMIWAGEGLNVYKFCLNCCRAAVEDFQNHNTDKFEARLKIRDLKK